MEQEKLENVLRTFDGLCPQLAHVSRVISMVGGVCEVSLDKERGVLFGSAVRFVNRNGSRWVNCRYNVARQVFAFPQAEWCLANSLLNILFPELSVQQVDTKLGNSPAELEQIQMRRLDHDANPPFKRKTRRQV